jgi:hypothetical protein
LTYKKKYFISTSTQAKETKEKNHYKDRRTSKVGGQRDFWVSTYPNASS